MKTGEPSERKLGPNQTNLNQNLMKNNKKIKDYQKLFKYTHLEKEKIMEMIWTKLTN